MSESTSRSVECPLCGETFDPTAAGGWCTNSECGEWQYDGAIETDDEAGAPADEESTDDVTDDPLFGGDDAGAEEKSADDIDDDADVSAADASDPLSEDLTESEASDGSTSELDDEADAPDASTGSAVDEIDDEVANDEPEDDELEPAPETDAEPESEPAVEPEDDEPEPAAESDEEPEAASAAEPEVDEAADETDDGAAEADTLDACPECDTAVGPSDAFCPGCGEDLDAHRESDDEEEVAETLDACPECGADVGPDDAFCASCGEDLDAHRGNDEDETLDACPGCGDDVEPDDAFCVSCGEDLDAHRAGAVEADEPATDATEDSTAAPTPSSLALSAYGRSVVVGDDETVGRQVRSLLSEAGKDEDQAVRIHREHVRFVRENDQFYVVDLGDNPTEVNGVRLSKGDREPIGPGDELGLSGVVTLDVEAP